MKNQLAHFTMGQSSVQMELPNEKEMVIPGVAWGKVSAFPSVSYWLYSVLSRRIEGTELEYKHGKTLTEEVGACLLGGHAITAEISIAAYEQLKLKGAFDGTPHSESALLEWLTEPIQLSNRTVKYRFARQKAKYIANALQFLHDEEAPVGSGKELRDWLLQIKGVGLKTASWVARNWLDADDVAILDIHIYRAGLLGGFYDDNLTIEKNYLQLEQIFIDLAKAMQVKASELDAVIWYEMQQSPSIHRLLENREQVKNGTISKNTIVYINRNKTSYTPELALA